MIRKAAYLLTETSAQPAAELRVFTTTAPLETPWALPCAQEPDRWSTTDDEGAKALCRTCPRRWQCAREACETPGAEGVWAGIPIPAGGRRRQFALKQLRSLAEGHGEPARTAS